MLWGWILVYSIGDSRSTNFLLKWWDLDDFWPSYGLVKCVYQLLWLNWKTVAWHLQICRWAHCGPWAFFFFFFFFFFLPFFFQNVNCWPNRNSKYTSYVFLSISCDSSLYLLNVFFCYCRPFSSSACCIMKYIPEFSVSYHNLFRTVN